MSTNTALTVDQLDDHGTTSHEVYTAGFYESSWDFSVRALLGNATRGGADIGEVLATIAGVKPKDDAGWFAAWVARYRNSSSEESHRTFLPSSVPNKVRLRMLGSSKMRPPKPENSRKWSSTRPAGPAHGRWWCSSNTSSTPGILRWTRPWTTSPAWWTTS